MLYRGERIGQIAFALWPSFFGKTRPSGDIIGKSTSNI
jgi:hypothetical protein